ncbi:hypothetical protein F4776DRAFT_662512 [Hypoxylon sp. NC0597]|nr:hypothetical protein F4776DRAFT_662512 [Hypoxylon sp. NC0597]
MASENKDIVVSIHTPIPTGYKFLPRGDPYMTLNCRKKARAEGYDVYVVRNRKHQQIGIRVPAAIHDRVQEKAEQTRKSRADAVQRKDKRVETNFRNSILSQYPKIPTSDLENVVKHATMKYSGRVGRTSKLALNEKTQLAVRAHVRHNHTDYDALLKNKMSKRKARSQILKKACDITKEWGETMKKGKCVDEYPKEIPDIEKKTSRKPNSNHKLHSRSKWSFFKEKTSMKRQASVKAAILILNNILAGNTAKTSSAR